MYTPAAAAAVAVVSNEQSEIQLNGIKNKRRRNPISIRFCSNAI